MFKFKHPFTGEQVEMSEHRFKKFKATYPHVHFDVPEQTEETTGEQVEEKPKKSKSPKKTEIDG